MKEEEFPEQREGEELIISAGKHWYLLSWPLAKVFLGLVLVFIVLRFLGASIYFTIAFFLWAGIGLTYFITTYIIWSKSKYYVTDQRIIRNEQLTLFAKKITEIDLSNIHNVTYEVSGVGGATFNFGNVMLQSYGAPKPIILKNVANAKNIQKKLSAMISDINNSAANGSNQKRPEMPTPQPVSHLKKYVPRKPQIEKE